MSDKIKGQVWELDLPANKLLVLLAMADHADHFGRNVFPSVDLVAWKTGYSRRQVQRVIKELVTDGILQAQPRVGKTTLYCIDVRRGTAKPPFKGGDILTPPTKRHPRQKDTPDKMSPESNTDTDTKTDSDSFDSKEKILAAKNSRKSDPLYDAVFEIWQAEAAENGLYRGILTGTAKEKGWKEYNLDTPITADELRLWAAWWKALPDNDGLTIVGKPFKVQSSITAWRRLGKPAPAARLDGAAVNARLATDEEREKQREMQRRFEVES